MINNNPLDPGHYSATNQMMIDKALQGLSELADKWADEASEAALSGNPYRAGYIEWMASRLLY